MSYQGDIWQVFILLMVLTIVAVNLGISVSTFARNEFQVVQFIPIVLVPQIFLSGVILPVENMPRYFQIIARVLPLRYGVDSLQGIMIEGQGLGSISLELAILGAFAIVLFSLAALSVRRI